ncbi:hypothetical protein JCM39194_10910 [Desulfotomaculum varum]
MKWELKSFSELFTFLPKSKIKAGEGKEEGKYPFFTCSSVLDKYYDDKIYSGECLVFGTGGNATLHYINGDFATSTDCFVVISSSEILVKYVYYFLFGNISILEEGFKGSGLKHISKSYLNSIQIPIPPLDIQRKIINALDQVLLLIEKRKEQIVVLDKLAKDTFIDMFGDPVVNPMGWERQKIKYFSEVKIGPFGSLLHAEDYISDGYPVINPQHIVNGKIIPNKEFCVNEEKYRELMNYHLKENDVVLARRGEIGRCAVVTPDILPLLCGTGSMIIRITEECCKCLALYLQSIISYPKFSAYLESKAIGSTMKNLNSGIVNELEIPLPPISLQRQFTERIEAIERQKERLKESLEELETLYKATMQKAFNGELF